MYRQSQCKHPPAKNQMSAMEIRPINILINCRKASAFPMRSMMIYPTSSPELLCCMTVHPTSCCVICYSRLTPWRAVWSCYVVWRLTQWRVVWGCCVVWRLALWAMIAVWYGDLPYVELSGIAVLYAGVLFLTTTIHIISLTLIIITVCTITTTYRAIICK